MATNFYKQNGSYFNATDNSKILNLTDLQTLAKAGGKEISAPVIPTPTPNKMDSSTLSLGVNNTGVAAQLPSSSDTATKLYADTTLQDATKQQATLQADLNQAKIDNLKRIESEKAAETANLNKIQSDKANQISGYDAQMNPLKDKAVGIYDSMLNSIKDTDYSSLTKTKLGLTNDIIAYSKMFSDELAQAQGQSGLSSVVNSRKNQVVENYTSKIAIAQAASSAIDGNFNLAFDIMDKGATAIERLQSDRINFINTVKGLFDSQEATSQSKLLSLSAEQKSALDSSLKDAQTKIDNLQKSKDAIMSVMQTNPIIAKQAGLALTDTPEQTTQKLNDLYVKYPQYTPDNQAWIKQAMEKYYDAGITMNDPLETVKGKITQSRIYQSNTKDAVVPGNSGVSAQGTVVDPTGNAYDISSYATDPNHEIAVQNLINGMGQFKSASDIDNYIKSKYPNSPITGTMIQSAAQKFGVSWEAMTAIMEQDSSLGTAGKGARTFNPGNVGNDDSGNIRNYGNWQSGVDAVAQWLSNHKTTASATSAPISESAKNWSNLINTGKAKLSDVPQDERGGVVTALAQTGAISKVDAEANAKLQDKITQLDDLIKGTSNSGAVGPNFLARTSLTSWVTGTRQAFVGSVKQLLSKETLDTLLNLKKGGGTLGALSDQERIMLQNAATKIGGWEMKDKQGNGTGFYNVREKDFIKELENIKTLAKRAIDNAGGETGVINTLEQTLANNPEKVAEYNTLVQQYPDLSEDEINQLLNN